MCIYIYINLDRLWSYFIWSKFVLLRGYYLDQFCVFKTLFVKKTL